ncbi:hypothetical protein CRUP_014368 [Coryphaenoides rupestris]|nr:hypothetical protein CRUP_014368 [Coryphaenoides rupestris]
MQQKGAIQIIEWEDLDKRKFYSLGVFMTMTTRLTVYPASLIRTLLQVQKGTALYSGTLDAFRKILRADGLRGLYRGFTVSTFTLVSGQAYITTYELVRRYVSHHSPSNTVKSLVAGGAASLVAQTITVPIDVVAQQLMMQGQGAHLTRFKVKPQNATGATVTTATPTTATKSRHLPRLTFGQTPDIVVQIFAADGFRGFYRGYVASLLTYIPNSALWWPFYHFYSAAAPKWWCCRSPDQWQQPPPPPSPTPWTWCAPECRWRDARPVLETFRQLLAEEGPRGMTKGLSARVISAMPTSVLIVVGYETLKRLSLRARSGGEQTLVTANGSAASVFQAPRRATYCILPESRLLVSSQPESRLLVSRLLVSSQPESRLLVSRLLVSSQPESRLLVSRLLVSSQPESRLLVSRLLVSSQPESRLLVSRLLVSSQPESRLLVSRLLVSSQQSA